MPGLTPVRVRLSERSVERLFIKKFLEQSNSKQKKLTNYFDVNQLTLK